MFTCACYMCVLHVRCYLYVFIITFGMNSLVTSNIRSGFGKVLYEKLTRDEELMNIDKSQWYSVDLDSVGPGLAGRFLQLDADPATEAFLAQCHEKADWIFTQVWHAFAKFFLSLFMSQTSANGWLRRGSMFVCSRAQFERLLVVSGDWRPKRLLDIGAGDGAVTDHIAPLFSEVFVTETSHVMRSILAGKNFTVLDVDTWHLSSDRYDVITCLNVLDRCDRPLQLLRHLADHLLPGGVLVLALVLPLRPYVENGANSDHTPVERMNIEGATFSEQLASFVDRILEPEGLEVVKWSRVPYLCEGDVQQCFYWLDDAVLVLKRRADHCLEQCEAM